MAKTQTKTPVQVLTKYQTSETITVRRDQILNAPYNPRKISPEALRALKNNIKTVGLLGGIVVNKRTMHIVSGHQRLTALDSLMRSKDYEIRVELIDLDEKTEKQQNIFMNSSSVQGEFDLDALKILIPEIDYKQAGLTEADLSIIGIVDYLPQFENQQTAPELNEAYQERKEKVKQVKSKVKDGYSDRFSTEPLVVLSFSDVAQKQAFLQRFGYDPTLNYINGEIFSEQIERIE